LNGRDFVTLRGYSKEDLETILHTAFDLKAKLARGEAHPFLAGKNIGMIFFTPSTRTRVSFEVGISQLGGVSHFYPLRDLQSGAVGRALGESWEDLAQVVSRYLDGLVIRAIANPDIPAVADLKWGEAHAILKTISENASIPIINAACDMEHPCQLMADVMTIIEKFGSEYKKRKVVMHWTPKGKRVPPGVPHSLLLAGAALGMNMTFAYPKGFELHPKYVADGERLAAQSGARIEIVHDKHEAVKDADVIYAKAWGALNLPAEEDVKLQKGLMDWCVTKEDFDNAAPGAIFMNPMPLERGKEASAEVVDGPMSVIYDEAENRIHAQKGIMSLIL
jgi:ornithine carbamoyltransferase